MGIKYELTIPIFMAGKNCITFHVLRVFMAFYHGFYHVFTHRLYRTFLVRRYDDYQVTRLVAILRQLRIEDRGIAIHLSAGKG
jgi:hypothetical protein